MVRLMFDATNILPWKEDDLEQGGDLLAGALALSFRGMPVFPCWGNKQPAVSRGFYSASTDVEEVKRMFSKPGVAMIGVPTGVVSGLIAIDVDVHVGKADGIAWYEDNIGRLPPTLTHGTLSGGCHLIFKMPEGIEIKGGTSRLAPGVDVQSNGKYIIVPPSAGYSILNECEPADMPPWLIEACQAPVKPSPTGLPATHRAAEKDAKRWGEKALCDECDDVKRAGEGTRNDRLYNAALKLGSIIAGGSLSRSTVENCLTRAAMDAGLDQPEIAKAIRSGIETGMRNPRGSQERSASTVNLDYFRPTARQIEKPESIIDIGAWRLDSFTKGTPPKQKFLLDPLFPLGVAGVLFGPGGVGKSLVALDLCMAVASRAKMAPGNLGVVQAPLGGRIPEEGGGSAIFLTLEDGKDDIHRRAVALDPGNSRAGLPCYVVPGVELADFEPSLIKNEDRVATLTRFAKAGLEKLLDDVEAASGFPPRLLVLDPAGDFISGPENEADFVKPLMRRLREIAIKRQCTILLIGHVSKGLDPNEPTMRGSVAWIANSRFAYALTKPQPEKRGSKRDMSGVIVGCLTKANHRGAPIDVRQYYRMDKGTGRLMNVTASIVQVDGEKPLDNEVLNEALMTGIKAAVEAGHAFTRTGPSGLYERRGDLPPCLSTISKRKLWALADDAVEEGLVSKSAGGKLLPAEEDQDEDASFQSVETLETDSEPPAD